MNLLIDIGNTYTKYVIENNSVKSALISIDNALLTQQYCNKYWGDVKAIYLSNVKSDSHIKVIVTWAETNNLLLSIIKSEKEFKGVTSGYDIPAQLGVDRWLALLGASACFSNASCLIVDSGTATTIDLLTAEGKHVGGWIIPGLALMKDTLLTKTDKINSQHLANTNCAFGLNTSENVNNGCLAASIGAIVLAIEKSKEYLPTLDHVIISGGNARVLFSMLSNEIAASVELIDNLVIKGLEQYIKASD